MKHVLDLIARVIVRLYTVQYGGPQTHTEPAPSIRELWKKLRAAPDAEEVRRIYSELVRLADKVPPDLRIALSGAVDAPLRRTPAFRLRARKSGMYGG